ncbi:MAG TPA: hypothetical protein VGF86_14085 [Candidatus Tumulicola sp.]|jgi:hypothetical protein
MEQIDDLNRRLDRLDKTLPGQLGAETLRRVKIAAKAPAPPAEDDMVIAMRLLEEARMLIPPHLRDLGSRVPAAEALNGTASVIQLTDRRDKRSKAAVAWRALSAKLAEPRYPLAPLGEPVATALEVTHDDNVVELFDLRTRAANAKLSLAAWLRSPEFLEAVTPPAQPPRTRARPDSRRTPGSNLEHAQKRQTRTKEKIMQDSSLEQRLDQLETQVERLVHICVAIQPGSDFTYWLLEKRLSSEQEEAVYALMNRLEVGIRGGKEIDPLDFEKSVEDALGLRAGEGHVDAASIINTFVQEGRYTEVTDALRASSWLGS